MLLSDCTHSSAAFGPISAMTDKINTTITAGFLIRKLGSKCKAHIWTGTDTACRMYSTGGLRPKKFAIYTSPNGHAVCHMCSVNSGRFAPASPVRRVDPADYVPQTKIPPPR
jgi:hypothetical protein